MINNVQAVTSIEITRAKTEIMLSFDTLFVKHIKVMEKYISVDLINRYLESRIPFNFQYLIDEINIVIALFNELNYFDKINLQYENLVQNQIINRNWNNMAFVAEEKLKQIEDLINATEKDINITLGKNEHNTVNIINNLINTIPSFYNTLYSDIVSILIFDKIKDITGNIVLIGANGSGKSTFARSLKNKLSSQIAVISAQHLLMSRRVDNISINSNEINNVYNFQSNDKLNVSDYGLYNNDLHNLISALTSLHITKAIRYYSGKKRDESILDTTFNIFKEIIESRELFFDENDKQTKVKSKGKIYEFNSLSDGEKAVFYYTAHVLLVKDNSYIVIDEPENHLHLSICNKLWDKLEKEREDCNFIYITHNIDFAISRNNKTVIWNKNFSPPANWDLDILGDYEELPQPLIMELVGSKKKILFCEGQDKSSLDCKLYNILFKQYTIQPVGGHHEVISHCKAYNRGNYGNSAIGLIDGDFHTKDQIDSWVNDNIYTLEFNEVENVLCSEELIKYAVEKYDLKEGSFEDFKQGFYDLLNVSIPRKATEYACQRMNNRLKENYLKEMNNFSRLNNEFNAITGNNNLQNLYNEYEGKIKDIISNDKFNEGIKTCSLKKELSRNLTKDHICNDYEERILKAIAKDIELQEQIRTKYFSRIPQ